MPAETATDLCREHGKTAYPDRRDAVQVVQGIREWIGRIGRRRPPIRVYWAPECRSWHITSKPRRNKKTER